MEIIKKPLNVVKPEDENPWYHAGLNFECTQCGNCCTGRPGYTWVSLDEIEKIATHLKLHINEFVKKYLRKVDGKWALLEYSESYDCIFLKDKRCSIYEVRPTQCRTFPWWRENLESKEAWDETRKRCEGINHSAPLVNEAKIKDELLKNEPNF